MLRLWICTFLTEDEHVDATLGGYWCSCVAWFCSMLFTLFIDIVMMHNNFSSLTCLSVTLKIILEPTIASSKIESIDVRLTYIRVVYTYNCIYRVSHVLRIPTDFVLLAILSVLKRGYFFISDVHFTTIIIKIITFCVLVIHSRKRPLYCRK